MTGVVYFVGAGPGAADLLTLRAARVLERADVVFHDALIAPETLALAPRAEKIAVGKRCGGHSTVQRFINKRLVDAAARYDVVVRLKGGDPMLFGRAQEEIAALEAANVPYEIVPGVTAALAAAAQIGTSLTQRGRVRSFAFATPRVGAGEEPSNWIDALRGADAGAIYMGLRQAPAIAEALIGAGRASSTPVAIVVDASMPDAQTHYTTLAALPAFAIGDAGRPALLLV
ncbi:MAG TPA: uroporphyrinogen-III C-methyltransferase, partial [Casimicrobiaceae bacterium]